MRSNEFIGREGHSVIILLYHAIYAIRCSREKSEPKNVNYSESKS